MTDRAVLAGVVAVGLGVLGFVGSRPWWAAPTIADAVDAEARARDWWRAHIPANPFTTYERIQAEAAWNSDACKWFVDVRTPSMPWQQVWVTSLGDVHEHGVTTGRTLVAPYNWRKVVAGVFFSVITVLACIAAVAAFS